ncbi:hypothetical protein BY996DRAFT_6413385 [Phakopsora pachyrhizi]|nr:hypothetical protein BY996DRAFT_6413385 [Phakopsora pachyrhizi]
MGRDSQNTLNQGGKTDEPIARNGIHKEKIRTKTKDSSFAERKDSSFKSRQDACQSSQSPDLVNVLLQQAENREIYSKFPVEKTGCRSKVINQADYKDINNFKGPKSEEDDSKLDYDVELQNWATVAATLCWNQ